MRSNPLHRLFCLATLALLAVGAAPPAAHAWWRGGVTFGVAPYAPYVPPYRYYYPPPVVYAPPAYYYPAPPPAGRACFAGPYTCPLAVASPINAPCSCPSNDGGRAAGRVG